MDGERSWGAIDSGLDFPPAGATVDVLKVPLWFHPGTSEQAANPARRLIATILCGRGRRLADVKSVVVEVCMVPARALYTNTPISVFTSPSVILIASIVFKRGPPGHDIGAPPRVFILGVHSMLSIPLVSRTREGVPNGEFTLRTLMLYEHLPVKQLQCATKAVMESMSGAHTFVQRVSVTESIIPPEYTAQALDATCRDAAADIWGVLRDAEEEAAPRKRRRPQDAERDASSEEGGGMEEDADDGTGGEDTIGGGGDGSGGGGGGADASALLEDDCSDILIPSPRMVATRAPLRPMQPPPPVSLTGIGVSNGGAGFRNVTDGVKHARIPSVHAAIMTHDIIDPPAAVEIGMSISKAMGERRNRGGRAAVDVAKQSTLLSGVHIGAALAPYAAMCTTTLHSTQEYRRIRDAIVAATSVHHEDTLAVTHLFTLAEHVATAVLPLHLQYLVVCMKLWMGVRVSLNQHVGTLRTAAVPEVLHAHRLVADMPSSAGGRGRDPAYAVLFDVHAEAEVKTLMEDTTALYLDAPLGMILSGVLPMLRTTFSNNRMVCFADSRKTTHAVRVGLGLDCCTDPAALCSDHVQTLTVTDDGALGVAIFVNTHSTPLPRLLECIRFALTRLRFTMLLFVGDRRCRLCMPEGARADAFLRAVTKPFEGDAITRRLEAAVADHPLNPVIDRLSTMRHVTGANLLEIASNPLVGWRVCVSSVNGLFNTHTDVPDRPVIVVEQSPTTVAVCQAAMRPLGAVGRGDTLYDEAGGTFLTVGDKYGYVMIDATREASVVCPLFTATIPEVGLSTHTSDPFVLACHSAPVFPGKAVLSTMVPLCSISAVPLSLVPETHPNIVTAGTVVLSADATYSIWFILMLLEASTPPPSDRPDSEACVPLKVVVLRPPPNRRATE